LPPNHPAQEYLSCWDELSTTPHKDISLLTYKTDRLIVPKFLRSGLLTKLHTDGHSGITRMKRLAQDIVYWPGISKDIKLYVDRCAPCQEVLPSQPAEPLIMQTATYPMEKMGCDLFSWNGGDYIALVDRYSGYLWCKRLRQTKTENVTKVLSDVFEEFGYPTSIQSDNGPQFRGPFQDFCTKWGIQHITSSPYNPASNGLAESAVKICKQLLKKTASSDETTSFSAALSAWRRTPRTQQGG